MSYKTTIVFTKIYSTILHVVKDVQDVQIIIIATFVWLLITCLEEIAYKAVQ